MSSSLLIARLERIGPCGISLSQLLVDNNWTRLSKYGLSKSQNFPFLSPLVHIDLTGNTDSACMYQTSASTIGRMYALYTAIIVHLLSGAWFGLDKLSTCLEAVPTKTNWYLCWEGYAEM